MTLQEAQQQIIRRIDVAGRLGGSFLAERSGMQRRLNNLPAAPEIYGTTEERLSYERGYREADQILALSDQLARTA